MSKTLKIIIIVGAISFIVVAVIHLMFFALTLLGLGPRGGRQRARDARVVANMQMMRLQAEFVFDTEGSYANVDCEAVGDIKNLCQDIAEQVGHFPTIVRSPSPVEKYCAYVQLLGKENRMPLFYCIDSAGNALKTTVNPTTTCGGGMPITYICPQAEK